MSPIALLRPRTEEGVAPTHYGAFSLQTTVEIAVGGSTGQEANLPALSLEVAFDTPAGQVYEDAAISDQPAGYYRFTETSGVTFFPAEGEQKATAFGGVTLNQTTLLTNDPNPSIALDGSSGYVQVGAHPTLEFPTELTLEAWIRPDVINVQQTVIHKEGAWGIKLNNGKLVVYYWVHVPATEGHPESTYQRLYEVPALSLSATTTYHIAFTVDDTDIWVYVNAVPVWHAYTYAALIARGADKDVYFGRNHTATPEYFDGRLDEVAVYPFALPKERIAYHYEARLVDPVISWTVISSDLLVESRLKELATKRGRSDELRAPETGSLAGVLVNQDRRFDPIFAAGPYYPDVKPVKQVRLRAILGNTTYDVWRGDILEWPQVWSVGQNDAVLTGTDAWDFLSGAEIEALSRPTEVTGARVHAILDAAGWPRSRRQIDTGITLMQAITATKGNAKQLLDEVNAVEAGELYVAGNGDIVFKNRHTVLVPPGSGVKAIFSNIPDVGEFPIVGASVNESKDTIRNSITVSITDGADYRAESPSSILWYRKRSHSVTLPFADVNEAPALAEWWLSKYAEPYEHVEEAIIEPQMDEALWSQCFGREIGDKVRFKIYPPGVPTLIDLTVVIEQIEHKYVVGRWTTRMKFSPANPLAYWILDTSELGTTTRLAY